jgi:HK97 family phage major capsid protein
MEFTEKDLQDKLEALKVKLEDSLTKKAKDEITLQIKAVSDQIAELKAALEKPDEATAKKFTDLEALLKEVKDAAAANQPVIDAFVANKQKGDNDNQPKSFGLRLNEAMTEKTDDIEKFIRKEKGHERLIIDLKTVGDMTIGNVTGGTRYGQQMRPGIIMDPPRRVHVRSLLTVASAGPGNTYTFMRENGAGEGSIAPTAETATKPQFDQDLVEATVNFETIAGWLRVTKKAMRNIPGFIAYLQQRLPERLLRAEDNQLLYGDGNTPNIKGITITGNHTDANTTSSDLAEALIDSIAQLEDEEERYADGILLRPRAYYNFFKKKAGGSGEYDLPRNFNFINGVLYVGNVPVFPSTAITGGDYITGDWNMGAQLLVQEGMKIEFFEQDGTNVRENKVTVRIEETVAFPVFGDNYFIYGNDVDQS